MYETGALYSKEGTDFKIDIVQQTVARNVTHHTWNSAIIQ
jgi:hypothetical protein